MSAITIMLIILVALLAGMEGILDEFQFHQPLVACTLIGLVSGHLSEGIILGGSLQMIALGWANVGAAVAPDAALASVAAVASWFFVALMNRSAIRAIRGSGVSSLTGCLQARSAGLRSSRSAPQAVRTDPRPSRSPGQRGPLRGVS